MKKLLFCHGFPYQKAFLSPLATSLKKDFLIEEINLGYFGNKHLPNISDLDGAIAIGHSLGFHYLLDLNIKFSAIIGISTILSFPSHSIDNRQVDNLINAYNHDKKLALSSLVGRNSEGVVYNLPFLDANWIELDNGLNHFIKFDSSDNFIKQNIPSLFLNGEDDFIYNVIDVKAQLSPYNLVLQRQAGHFLGYSQLAFCREEILKFINNLNK